MADDRGHEFPQWAEESIRNCLYSEKVKKKIGDAGFRRNGADELIHKRLRQAGAPPRAMRKPLGIAYVGDMFFPKTCFRSVFGRTGA